jgi:hypothetical protein
MKMEFHTFSRVFHTKNRPVSLPFIPDSGVFPPDNFQARFALRLFRPFSSVRLAPVSRYRPLSGHAPCCRPLFYIQGPCPLFLSIQRFRKL